MNQFNRTAIALLASMAAVFPASQTIAQTALDQVGFTQLQAEIGVSLETGAGILVGQVEAPTLAAPQTYLPDTTNIEFAGKTIVDGSGANVGSYGHATGVGQRQYGNTSSVSPGVTNITGYNANDWIGRVLGYDNSPAAGLQKAAPLPQNFSVMNHSYIGNTLPPADATEINHRMDFLVNQDNITMAVGTNNGNVAAVPQLFAHSYNTITVGRTDGEHWHGLTTLYGAGRVKPEIVAPQGATSYATPMVAAAATLLRQQGNASMNPNAIRNEVTKAVLLAGATKDEFPTWSNSETQPLDLTFGAGELNIYNSYHIMAGGEFNGSSIEASTPDVTSRGWDYASITASENLYYNFDVTSPSADASIILTWNADISETAGMVDFDPNDLADLNLMLYDSSSSFLGSLSGQSISTVDNTEHLFLQGLGTGEYTIAVSGLSGATNYALAWQFTAVPEPTGLASLLTISWIFCLRRQRRNTPCCTIS